MARICPRCGNANDDTVKFCTSCGQALAPRAGNRRTVAILAAGIVILGIAAIMAFSGLAGPAGILPGTSAPQTPSATPTLTSYVVTEIPVPETTTPIPATTTVPLTTTLPPTTLAAIVCPSDRFACAGACRNLMTDRENCGRCNTSCAITEICQQGHCTIRCADTETSCNGICRDLRYDAQNCGICGNSCPGGLGCNMSVCSPTLTTPIPTYVG